MVIRNTSNRVIGIGSLYLMPDNEGTISEEIANLPSVKALVAHGHLKFMEAKAEEKPAPVVAEPVEVTEEKPAEKPKRTRKKKEEVTE